MVRAILCERQHSGIMTRLLRRLPIDSTEFFYGFFPGMAIYAAFVSWASLIVRAIRGGDAKEDWRTFISSAAALTAFVLLSSTRVRETAALRSSAIELRNIAHETAEADRRRDQDMADRAARDAKRQDQLNRLTTSLVVLATLTLAAAIVTLAVALAG